MDASPVDRVWAAGRRLEPPELVAWVGLLGSVEGAWACPWGRGIPQSEGAAHFTALSVVCGLYPKMPAGVANGPVTATARGTGWLGLSLVVRCLRARWRGQRGPFVSSARLGAEPCVSRFLSHPGVPSRLRV